MHDGVKGVPTRIGLGLTEESLSIAVGLSVASANAIYTSGEGRISQIH